MYTELVYMLRVTNIVVSAIYFLNQCGIFETVHVVAPNYVLERSIGGRTNETDTVKR